MALNSTAKLSALSRTTDTFARFLNEQETHDFKHAHCLSFLKRVVSSCISDDLVDEIPFNLEIHLKSFKRDLPDIHFLMQAFIAHYRRLKFNIPMDDELLDGYCYDTLKVLSRRIENFTLSKSSTPSEALLWLDRYISQYLTSYFRTWWAVFESLLKESVGDLPEGECYAIELERFGRSLKRAVDDNITMLSIIINTANTISIPNSFSLSQNHAVEIQSSLVKKYPKNNHDGTYDHVRFEIIKNTLSKKFHQLDTISILFLCYRISNDYEKLQTNRAVYRNMGEAIVTSRLLIPLMNFYDDFGLDFLQYMDGYVMDMTSSEKYFTILDCIIIKCNKWVNSITPRNIEVTKYNNFKKVVNLMKLKGKI